MYNWCKQDCKESQLTIFGNHITQVLREAQRWNVEYPISHKCHEWQRKFRTLINMMLVKNFHRYFTDICFSIDTCQ